MIINDFLAEEINRPLKSALAALKPEFIRLVQREYDYWPGTIGLCDTIADVIRECVKNNIRKVKTSIIDKNSYHYWVRVWSDSECYDIDIPFGKYETYNYKTNKFIKIPNVKFTTRDIFIYRSARQSLKTPWELKKSYVPHKSDRYYMTEVLKLTNAIVHNKKTPIDGEGWLLPDGKFISFNMRRDYVLHVDVAREAGFSGYDDAYAHGWIRISRRYSGKNNGRYYLETKLPMNDKMEQNIVEAIRRMVDVVYVTIWVGEGKTFQKFEWNGKEIVKANKRSW